MGRTRTELIVLCVLVAVVSLKAKDTQGQHTLANTSITALYVGQKSKCIRIRLKLQLETNRKENDMRKPIAVEKRYRITWDEGWERHRMDFSSKEELMKKLMKIIDSAYNISVERLGK